MKKSILFSILSLIYIAIVFLSCQPQRTEHATITIHNKIENGKADFSNITFDERTIAKLNGDWYFF